MGIAHELGQSAKEAVDLGKETGGDIIGTFTDKNLSLLHELFTQPIKAGTGILGISLRTVGRIAGVLGFGAAKTVAKAGAALPLAPMPSRG